MTDEVRAAKSPRQRHREACAALDAAVALNDADAMREALREIKAAETDDQSYADPLAALVAAKCGVRSDDEAPPEQRDQRSTRDLAVADSPIIDRVFAHEVDIAGPDEPKTAPTADEAEARLQ